MKKIILYILFAIAVGTMANAQQISVVAPSGATTLYTSLDSAIIQAVAGSTVYLSGGGFQVKDETKITKKLTIIGIGHKPDNDNADGSTMVGGNLFFESGANNSALMGVYLSGNVYIGTDEVAINNFLLRYCNVNSVQVRNSNCQDIVINQNYIRNISYGGESAIRFTNNVVHTISFVNGGAIDHNVIRHSYNGNDDDVLYAIQNSQVFNNILMGSNGTSFLENSVIRNNMITGDWKGWGDWRDEDESYGSIKIVGDWGDVFEGPITGVTPVCNYSLKGSQGKNAATDGTDIGIYGGTGFSDSALPPVPRIVSKIIPEQTDENGKLNIQVYVKAK
ncbi:MAG: hypothetical protein LBL79_12040 [Prevotella sp.]|jgi:hypothetical protein|nr:hypothetical protein [Prevotella sp.]